ncbi:MAG: hypothetical protein R2769_08205 [Saprospiraceae bacterium]
MIIFLWAHPDMLYQALIGGYATVNYDVAVNDTLSSVWIRIENPIDGDTTWAIVAATTNGAPNFVIAEGIPVIIQAGV